MDDKARLARNEYMRMYRKKNAEKIKEINSRYWESIADKNEKRGADK